MGLFSLLTRAVGELTAKLAAVELQHGKEAEWEIEEECLDGSIFL